MNQLPFMWYQFSLLTHLEPAKLSTTFHSQCHGCFLPLSPHLGRRKWSLTAIAMYKHYTQRIMGIVFI